MHGRLRACPHISTNEEDSSEYLGDVLARLYNEQRFGFLTVYALSVLLSFFANQKSTSFKYPDIDNTMFSGFKSR